MKISGILGSGLLLIAIIVIDNLAAAKRQSCLCGGLGTGTNPCRCENGISCGATAIKAAKTPRPIMFASESAINEAAAARDAAARAENVRVTFLNSASGGFEGCGGRPRGDVIVAGGEDEGGLTAQDLLSMDPRTPIAPRFKPIGDLCHTSSPVPRQDSSRTTTTVVPAYPGKLKCLAGNAPLGAYESSSSGSRSGSGFYYGSGSSTRSGYGQGLSTSCSQQGTANSYSGSSSTSGIYSGNSGSTGYASYNWPGSGNSFGDARGSYGDAMNGLFGVGSTSGPFGSGYSRATTSSSSFGVNSASGLFGSGPFGSTGNSGVPNSLSATNPSLNEFDNEEDEGLTFEEQEKIYNGQTLPQLPADPVSVTLAYRNLLTPRVEIMKKKMMVPEERLSFGPRTTPADGRVQKAPTTDVPEEKLQIVDKPIVELKQLSSGTGYNSGDSDVTVRNVEEELRISEALERQRMEMESEAMQSGPGTSGAYITYSDLGYGPIGPSRNQFISAPVEYASTDNGNFDQSRTTYEMEDSSPCGPLGPPLPGYRPGGVIFQQEVSPKNGHVDSHGRNDQDQSVEDGDGYNSARSYDDDDGNSDNHRGRDGSHGSDGSSSSDFSLSQLWKKASHHRAGSSCLD